MSTLYLMRHAQTVFNERRLIQGSCNSALTPLGVRQAEAAGSLMGSRGMTFDRAFCSTHERACDTLEIVTAKAYGSPMPYERLRGLCEMDFGSFEAASSDLYDERFIDSDPDFYLAFGGESVSGVQRRMVETLRDIASRNGGSSLVVSSSNSILLFCRAVGIDPVREGALFPNCASLVLDVLDGTFSLRDTLVPRVDQDVA
ncbi:MAG: histidine phosphatase family protein [Atopobiaceae bacterium]